MKATFDQHIGIFEDALPPEWCSNIINQFEQIDTDKWNRNEELNKNSDQYSSYKLEKDDIRSNIWNLKNSKEVFENLNQNLSKCWGNYIIENEVIKSYYGYEKISFTGYMIQKTPPGKGFHSWHTEWFHTLDSIDRVAVWTAYLNDIKEGGETEFLYQHKRISPKTGTICIFPAFYTHVHRGNPPLKNTKYIITGWVEFPPLNELNNE